MTAAGWSEVLRRVDVVEAALRGALVNVRGRLVNVGKTVGERWGGGGVNVGARMSEC